LSRFILVRHGSAGLREKWSGEDRVRPLDERGCAQAAGLVDVLSGQPIDCVCSSPYARCVETAEPLARARGLQVEPRDELAEGAAPSDVHALLDELAEVVGVLCTHGDIAFSLSGRDLEKGAAYVLERRGGEIVVVERVRPPA
jgi:8-oxo-(d)GTP phosphatase